MTEPVGWESWAPPLNPPDTAGLSAALAQQIAEASFWPVSPHLTAALQWEAFAATLEPTLPVSTVSTGAQSVGFEPAAATGPYGEALRQAEWHRSYLTDTYSVPLTVGPGSGQLALPLEDEEPPPEDEPVVQPLLAPGPQVQSTRGPEIQWGPEDT